MKFRIIEHSLKFSAPNPGLIPPDGFDGITDDLFFKETLNHRFLTFVIGLTSRIKHLVNLFFEVFQLLFVDFDDDFFCTFWPKVFFTSTS